MVRIRVLDVDGEAADVQEGLAQLRGVMPAAAEPPIPIGALLERPPGSARPSGARASDRRSTSSRKTRRPRKAATPSPEPPAAEPPPPTGPIEEVSVEEDVGARFVGDEIHIRRQGYGRHQHEFVLPDSACAAGAPPQITTCTRLRAGKPCPETRTFRLV